MTIKRFKYLVIFLMLVLTAGLASALVCVPVKNDCPCCHHDSTCSISPARCTPANIETQVFSPTLELAGVSNNHIEAGRLEISATIWDNYYAPYHYLIKTTNLPHAPPLV